MATSKVECDLVPAKPEFKKGELVIANNKLLVICEGGSFKTGFAGTVLSVGSSSYTIGHYSNCFSKSAFRPFRGSVTLTEQ